jgi:FtsH-binding integral membrane protein
MIQSVEKLSKNYMKQGLFIAVGLTLITLLVMQIWFLDLLTPAIISAVFALVMCWTIGLIWRRVAKRSPESLPTFFTAVSGFRLLLALAVMFVYYLVDTHDSMLRFFLVFMAFYIVSLVHHTIFFARVSNRS